MKALVLGILVAGCGGDNNNMNTNSLIGTWSAVQSNASSQLTFTFHSNNTYDEALGGLDSTTNCSAFLSLTGTFTSTATTVSTIAQSGTYKATGCTDPIMNANRAAMPNELTAYSFSNVTYTFSGNMLTMTLMGETTTFAKQ
jgi:hypothetical protein